MTNPTEDRLGKLDDLYDQACEKLSESPAEPEAGTITPEVVELATVMLQHYTGIIDRWLQVREADRQYELQPKPVGSNEFSQSWSIGYEGKEEVMRCTNCNARWKGVPEEERPENEAAE